MEIFAWYKILGLAVAQKGKPAVYVSSGLDLANSEDDKIWNFVIDRCKELFGDGTEKFHTVVSGIVGDGLFFFDTKEEQYAFYSVFEAPLTDSSAIYACTYSADGVCQTENT